MVKCIMICDVLVCCNNKDILPHRSLRLPQLKTARGRSITFDIQVTGICAEKKHKLQNSVSSTMRRDTMSTWPDTESGLGHDIWSMSVLPTHFHAAAASAPRIYMIDLSNSLEAV